MKKLFLLITLLISTLCNSASSYDNIYSVIGNEDNNTESNNINDMKDSKIKITVNSHIFTATLLDNKSA